jgi:hypothetical protein
MSDIQVKGTKVLPKTSALLEKRMNTRATSLHGLSWKLNTVSLRCVCVCLITEAQTLVLGTSNHSYKHTHMHI